MALKRLAPVADAPLCRRTLLPGLLGEGPQSRMLSALLGLALLKFATVAALAKTAVEDMPPLAKLVLFAAPLWCWCVLLLVAEAWCADVDEGRRGIAAAGGNPLLKPRSAIAAVVGVEGSLPLLPPCPAPDAAAAALLLFLALPSPLAVPRPPLLAPLMLALLSLRLRGGLVWWLPA